MSTKSVNVNTGKVMTVKGPIDPSDLGVTLMHEHLFWNETFKSPNRFTPATESAHWSEKLTLENLHLEMKKEGSISNAGYIQDVASSITEANEFKNWGGSTIVDVTNIGRPRDPRGLLSISNSTGLNIVMGCSWYQPRDPANNIANRTLEELTNDIVHEITVGVHNTNIRAGIIGEVGIRDNFEATEVKVMKASARASRATGAAISLHWGGLGREKFEIIEIIGNEGADLTRTIFGHSDLIAHDLPFVLELLQHGVYIQFDLLGRRSVPLTYEPTNTEDPWSEYITFSGAAVIARTIISLIKAGYANRILISQDVAAKKHLKQYGGAGYSFISETFLPNLRKLGADEQQINQIVVENPKRVLTLAKIT